MPTLQTMEQDIAQIQTAVYGEEVRGAIIDGLRNCYENAEAQKNAAYQSARNAEQAAVNASNSAVAAQNAVNTYNNITAQATTLGTGSSATAVMDHSGTNPVLKLGIPTGPQGPQGTQGAKGADGRGIINFTKTGTSGLVDTYQMNFTSGNPVTIQVTNGNGIRSFKKDRTENNKDYYIMTFTDGSSKTITVTNGQNGINGSPGIGISGVSLVGSQGKVDTYRISYTNGTSTEFQVTNGTDGRGIIGVQKVSSIDGVDTYQIDFTDGTSTQFTLTNANIDDTVGAGSKNKTWSADKLVKTLETKAENDGYYQDLTAGNAEQLISSQFAEDKAAYIFRKAGGTKDVGNRAYLDKIVGGTIGWNQQAQDGKGNTILGWSSRNGTISQETDYIRITASAATGSGLIGGRSGGVPGNHKYLMTAEIKLSVPGTMLFSLGGVNGTAFNIEGTEWTKCAAIWGRITDNAANTPIYILKNGASSAGDTIDFRNIQCFDLTQMFGSTIADYIYSLEQASAGAGVAWFRKLFPKVYYEYNAGELISVNALSHDTVGFNQWDEEWEVTTHDGMRSVWTKNFVKVLPATSYCFNMGHSTYTIKINQYDQNKNLIKSQDYGLTNHIRLLTTEANCAYILVGFNQNYGTAYQNDVCINLSHSGYRNGEYEAYEKHSYPMADIDLRGILKLDENNELYYDGDEYLPEGKVKRKYGIVDLGTLNWTKYNTTSLGTLFRAVFDNLPNDTAIQLVLIKYKNSGNTSWANQPDKTYQTYQKSLYIKDSGYTEAEDFKVSLNGVYAVYPLAAPTEEEVDSFTQVQVVDDFGTEELVTGNPLPVYAVTHYPINLRDKLQHLPSLADDDGRYLVKQTGTQMELVKETPPEDFVAGNAEQLIATQYAEDSVPYKYRTTGGNADVGNRAYLDKIVGGSMVWNQLCRMTSGTSTANGLTIVRDAEKGTITVNGTSTNRTIAGSFNATTKVGDVMFLSGCPAGGNTGTWALIEGYGAFYDVGNGRGIIGKAGREATTIQCVINSGIECTNLVFRPQLMNLTQMFGTAVADYLYSLGDAGVALFRSWFPEPYYEYNAGELISVEGLQKRKTVGFNLWDEEWELGAIDTRNGATTDNSTFGRSKNYSPILPGVVVYPKVPMQMNICYYDENKIYITNQIVYANGTVHMTPENAHYFKITASGWTTYNHDVCINLSWSGSRNGEYAPYESHEYPLDSSLVLRGIPKLVDGEVKWDGDEYTPDGKVKRRYIAETFTGATSEDWSVVVGDVPRGVITRNTMKSYGSASSANFVCDKLIPDATGSTGTIRQYGSQIWIFPPTTVTDVAALRTWLAANPVTVVYELATQTEETAEPYTEVQIVDDCGTEEFISDGIVPVGHKTKYPANLRDKLQHLPDLASGDGNYMIQQNGSQMTLVPFVIPQTPTANGTYVLKVTVSGGTPTYKWEAAT